MTRPVPLTPQQADTLLEKHGWTLVDLYQLLHAFARKLQPTSSMKMTGGRVLLWIKKETKR